VAVSGEAIKISLKIRLKAGAVLFASSFMGLTLKTFDSVTIFTSEKLAKFCS
jgi:hypothetical protein